MKHLFNFDTLTEYNDVKDTLEKPYVVTIDETNGLKYNTDVIRVPEGSCGGGGSSSGGEATANNNDVIFYDCDGTELHKYSWEDACNLTELPILPSRPNLICTGWNYTLDDIRAQTYHHKAHVGAIYNTVDDYTRYYLKVITPGEHVATLNFEYIPNCDIDWGDGNVETVTTKTITHSYTTTGNYVICIKGSVALGGGGYSQEDFALYFSRENLCYGIELGNVTLRYGAFYKIQPDYIVLSNNVSLYNNSNGNFGNSNFIAFPRDWKYTVYPFVSGQASFPNTVETITAYALPNTRCIVFPESLQYYNSNSTKTPNVAEEIFMGSKTKQLHYDFRNCGKLKYIKISDSCAFARDYKFAYCSGLEKPEYAPVGVYGTTSLYYIGWDEFELPEGSIITETSFQGCSIKRLTLPSNIIDLKGSSSYSGSLSFVKCKGDVSNINYFLNYIKRWGYLDLRANTQVPTLTAANSDRYVIIPDNLYDEWIAATNWSAYPECIIKASKFIEPEL